MMNHDDILRQIPDYVLGLLPRNQLHIVEQHVAHCSTCQHAMVSERELRQLVRSTVEVASQTDPAHIRNLMPSIPQRRESKLIPRGWQKQLAPALLLLILLVSGLILNNILPEGSVPGFVATAHAATATRTYTPTATLVQAIPDQLQTSNPMESEEPVWQAVVPETSVDVYQALETPYPDPASILEIRQTSR